MTVTQENAEALVAQVEAARLRLAAAAATADLSGVAAALDELEVAHGQARASGIAIPRPSTGAGESER